MKKKRFRMINSHSLIKKVYIIGIKKIQYNVIGSKIYIKKLFNKKFFFIKAFIFLLLFFLFFYLGIIFNTWGGINRLAPLTINFIRDNILGDKIVLQIEKNFFTFNDYIKQKINNNNYKKNNPKLNEYNKIDNAQTNYYVTLLTEKYINDYTLFRSHDYNFILKFIENSIPNIKPFYNDPIFNEGVWEKHIISPITFKPLYAKTFIRSDLLRDYVKVYIYIYDMDRLKLDFIPGYKDCNKEQINGKMTAEQKNKVLWIFSGGYQYKHGRYGMKYNGEILLPPRDGAQTIFFHKDGSFKIEKWTKDTTDDENIIHFRQNELPLIYDGKTNHQIKYFWGFTPDDENPIYTVRSGIGITKNNSLVLAFGENLSAKTLSLAMTKAGVKTGMHLDMNYFNVHFIRVERTSKGKLKTKNENDILSYYKNIYLNGSPRDYFIITEK